jgi:hypothetical protein
MSTDNVNTDPEPVDDRDEADVHDIVQEDEDDVVANVDDAVEDVRTQVVTNHFRV